MTTLTIRYYKGIYDFYESQFFSNTVQDNGKRRYYISDLYFPHLYPFVWN